MISPRSPSSSSSSSSSTSDSDGGNSSLDEAEHIVHPKSGVFHLKREVEPLTRSKRIGAGSATREIRGFEGSLSLERAFVVRKLC